MPKVFVFKGFSIFIWTNEDGEPVHVHVSRGVPSKSNVKIWLLSDGTFKVQKNPDYRIVSARDLCEICLQLPLYQKRILKYWLDRYGFVRYVDTSGEDSESKTSLFN